MRTYFVPGIIWNGSHRYAQKEYHISYYQYDFGSCTLSLVHFLKLGGLQNTLPRYNKTYLNGAWSASTRGCDSFSSQIASSQEGFKARCPDATRYIQLERGTLQLLEAGPFL